MNITATMFCIHDTLHCSLNNQEEITQKVCKLELSFLYATHLHNLIYITVKCHYNIPKGIKVTERT